MKPNPSIQASKIENFHPFNSDDVSPHSSAIFGITVVGNAEDALAVLRTAFLVAKSLKATLYLDIAATDADPLCFGEVPSASASDLVHSVRPHLHKLRPGQDFVLEVTVTAASFVSDGIISMRIRGVAQAAEVGTKKQR